MKKLLLGIALIPSLLIMFAMYYNPSANVLENLQTNEGIVQISVVLENAKGSCSGAVISDEFVLTAAHCLILQGNMFAPPTPILNYTITQNGDLKHTAAGAFYNASPESDLGVIQGDFKSFRKLPIETNKMRFLGSGPFYSCGFAFFQTQLTCLQLTDIEPWGFAYAAHGQLVRGMSGGPVFDLSSGSPIVIAVNTAVLSELHTSNNPGVILSPIVGLRGLFDMKGL